MQPVRASKNGGGSYYCPVTEGARGGEADRTPKLAQLPAWRGPLTGAVCLVGRRSQQSPGGGRNTLTSLSSPF